MDVIIGSRIEAMAAAYRDSLDGLIVAHWSNRAAALHALSLYYETQTPRLDRMDFRSSWDVSERVRGLLLAYRAVLAKLPPSGAPATLTFATTGLRHARDVLQLADEIRLFEELRHLSLLGAIDVALDDDVLIFADPRGTMFGPVLQTVDDLTEAYQGSERAFAEDDTLAARMAKCAEIARREQADISLHVMACLMTMRSSLPPRRRGEPPVWGCPPDAIAHIYAPQQAYRERLRLYMEIEERRAAHLLPNLPPDTMIGAARWRDIVRMRAFLSALSFDHHRTARRDDTAPASKKDLVFVPPLPPATHGRRFHPGSVSDLVVDTSTAALADLAADITGCEPNAVHAILDAATVRDLPPAKIALHHHMLSGLVEIDAGRLLLVPALGLFAADPDMVLRLAMKLDPQRYSATLGNALGDAPAALAIEFRARSDLKVIVDRNVYRADGSLLSDIDLGVYDPRDQTIVLMEFKSLWLQDAESRVEPVLSENAGRLRRIAERLIALGPEQTGSMFGVHMVAMPRIIVILVTRRHYATGFAFGCPVLPHAAIRRLLRESGGRLGRFADLALAFGQDAVFPNGITQGWVSRVVGRFRWKAPSFSVSGAASDLKTYLVPR